MNRTTMVLENLQVLPNEESALLKLARTIKSLPNATVQVDKEVRTEGLCYSLSVVVICLHLNPPRPLSTHEASLKQLLAGATKDLGNANYAYAEPRNLTQ